MKMKIKSFIPVAPAFALATLLSGHIAQAGSHTWSGVNSAYFNNASNWSYGGAPTNGEQNVYLYFPSGASRYTCQNNISGLVVTGIGISGDNYSINGNSISFVATGQPFLTSSGSANAIDTSLIINTNVNVNVSAGQILALSAPISGGGGLTTVGAGTVLFNGVDSNTYTGTTYVNSGTLTLARGSGLDGSIAGPLVVGLAVGSQGTAIAKLASNNQIADSSTVTVNFTGVLDAANNSDWIEGLVLAGGQVHTGTGMLALEGDLTVQAGSATIDGKLGLYNPTNCTMNTEVGGALTVTAAIFAFKD